MIDRSLISRTEEEIYLEYERQRRTQMLRVILPTFLGIDIVALVIVTIYLALIANNPLSLNGHTVFGTFALIDGAFAGITVLLAIGLVAARSDRLTTAAISVIAASALGAVGLQIAWDVTQGFGPYSLIELATFGVPIILTGILSGGWAIVIVTVVMDAIAGLLLVAGERIMPLPGVATSQVYFFVLPNALLAQWIFAAIMFAIVSSFRRSLGQLGLAYERSRQLEDLKDQFISSVNHELRTPIMTMHMYIKTALSTLPRLSREDLELALSQSARVGDSLVALVQSILSTRRVEQEVADITPAVVDVRDVLDTAIGLLDPREGHMVERELFISVPGGLTVWGDPIRVQQILTNLLSNAVKYSPPGSPIEVSAKLAAPDARGAQWRWRTSTPSPAIVEIVVRDHGLGVPPAQIPLLFNRFVRLPRDLASRVVGNGLGLYLCRVLTEAMGGKIWLESSGVEGEGSAFHMTLPVPHEPPQPATPERAPALTHATTR